jgi:hypothetical protein
MKKILLVIDDEKREISAEYFDLNVSSGIGEGYDAIFCVETRKGEISESVEGVPEHPLKNAVLLDLIPANMTLPDAGLGEDLKMQRNVAGLTISLGLDSTSITEKVGYEKDGYDIQVPGILHTAVRDLVAWEQEKSQGRAFMVSVAPIIIFTNGLRTQFKVIETIQIQTGIVEKAHE